MNQKQVFSRLWANVGTLLMGNVLVSIIGFISFVLIARALEPSELGVLALIQAYMIIMGSLISFQSWHAVTRFGADSLHLNDSDDFRRLIKFGTLLDIVGALLGAILAAVAVFYIGRALGWDPYSIKLAATYCIVIAFDLTGTPKAVLRLFNRFNLIVIQQLATATFKLIAVYLAYITTTELVTFVAISAVALILGNIFLLVLGWRELHLRGYNNIFQCRAQRFVRDHPSLWGFVWTTNLSGSVGIVTKEFDIMLVGGLLDTTSAGVYRIVKQFAVIFSKPLEALYHAVYPELARLWAGHDISAFQTLAFLSSIWSGTVALLVWGLLALWGDSLLQWAVGPDYSDAFPVLLWYTLGMVVAIFAFPLQPSGFCMGLSRLMLISHMGSTLFYLICLPVLLIVLGLSGAGIAALLFQAVWALSMLVPQKHVVASID